jgi:hypothetical protein
MQISMSQISLLKWRSPVQFSGDLGDNLKRDQTTRLCNENAAKTAEDVVKECKAVFEQLIGALDGTMGAKGIFGRVSRVKFASVQSRINLMRGHLEKLKSTLHLMLEVLNYARQLRR